MMEALERLKRRRRNKRIVVASILVVLALCILVFFVLTDLGPLFVLRLSTEVYIRSIFGDGYVCNTLQQNWASYINNKGHEISVRMAPKVFPIFIEWDSERYP